MAERAGGIATYNLWVISYKMCSLTRPLWGGRIEDACGGVTGHPYRITAHLDPWRGGWLVGCALGLGWPVFGVLEAPLGSFVASSGVIRGHFGPGGGHVGIIGAQNRQKSSTNLQQSSRERQENKDKSSKPEILIFILVL